jgi:sulfate adenylyltransferase subunit 2
MSGYHLDHLQHLETEAIHIMRECAGEFERPALLFSGGKDSICLLRLAEKAFRPRTSRCRCSTSTPATIFPS